MPKILLDYERLDYPYEPDTVRLPNGSDIDTCAGEVLGKHLHLVLYRASLDDVPLKVFTSHKHAKAYAKEVAKHYCDDVEWSSPQWTFNAVQGTREHHPDVEKQLQHLAVEASTLIALQVVPITLQTSAPATSQA